MSTIEKKRGLMSIMGALSIFSVSSMNLVQAGADDVLSYQLYYASKTSDQKGTNPYDLFGLYTYYGFGKNSLEFAVDGQSSKNYENGSPVDLAVVYGNYDIPNMALKVGMRASDIDDVANQTNIGILGAQYTQYSPYGFVQWLVGMDAYFLDAKDNALGVDSTQLSPYIGGYLVTEKIPVGHSLFFKFQMNTQTSDGDPALDIDKKYDSVQLSGTYTALNWSAGLDLIGGRSQHLLETSGFVYNFDNYTYQEGAKVWASLAVSKTGYIKPWFKLQSVDQTATNLDVGELYTAGLLIGGSF